MDRAMAHLWLVVLAAAASAAAPVDGVVPAGEDEREEKSLAAKPVDAAPLVSKLGHEHWRVREAAMRGLIRMGGAARDALRAARRSGDAEVRWRAAYALSQIERPFAPAERDDARLLYASAVQAHAQTRGADAARLLYAEVVKRYPTTRWAAAARERLARLGSDGRPGPKARAPEPDAAGLVDQLGSPDWAVRQRASWRLAALGEGARPALERGAKAPDPEVAWRARRLLERLAAARGGHGLGRAARRPSVRLSMLARLFGEDGPPSRPSDLGALVEALASSDAGEVAHAREVLLNLGPDAVAALVGGLDACGEVAAVEVMDLLGRITKEGLGFDRTRWQAWWRAVRKAGGR